jgi:salicylate hydroxylase
MPSQGRTVVIAGAGLAGLTLALALAKFGASVVVLERNERIAEFGAGVQLSPNARRVLNQLGLDRAISGLAFEPAGIDVIPFAARTPAVTLALGPAAQERYGVPYAVIHRADLVEALYKAAKRFANIDIALGVSAFDVRQTATGIAASFDRPGAERRAVRGFAFVGADGVHSRTRLDVLAGPAASYTGYTTWRVLLDLADTTAGLSPDRTTLLLGPGYHAVAYPLPRRQAMNVALFARSPQAGDTMPALRRPGDRFAALLASAGDRWTPWPLHGVSADDWHKGAIGLVGDAAHAMVPFQAQGAAMAMEDAAILAPLLMTEPTAGGAFARYVALRRARVHRVTQLSESNGRAFHLPWPLSLGRDAVLKAQGPLGHFRRLDWLYDYDTAPEVEIGGPKRPS